MRILFADVLYLLKRGLIRGFENEMECAEALAQYTSIITMKERGKIVGGIMNKNKPKIRSEREHDTNGKVGTPFYQLFTSCEYRSCRYNKTSRKLFKEFMKSVMNQRSILQMFRGGSDIVANKTKKCLLPILKMFDQIVDNSLREKDENLSKNRLAIYRKNGGAFCFRLKEDSLITLRRCCRLFLCAGNGPGNMRCESWIDCIANLRRRSHNLSNDSAVIVPNEKQWSALQYPGLQQRLLVRHFEFQLMFEPLQNQSVNRTVFLNVQSFRGWEIAAEVRAMMDFLVEGNDVYFYVQKKYNESAEIEDIGVLHSDGRHALIQKLLWWENSSMRAKEVLGSVDKVLQSLQSVKAKENCLSTDCFVNNAERMICNLCVCLAEILKFRLQAISKREKEHFNRFPFIRHLMFESVITYCIYDGIPVLEKRGYFHLAYALTSLILGMKENGRSDASNFLQLVLPRRSRGKALERHIINRGHIARYDRKVSKSSGLMCKDDSFETFHFNIIKDMCSTVSVPFSSIRSVARRLKRPLNEILDHSNIEQLMLAIRSNNEDENRLKEDTNVNRKSNKRKFRKQNKQSCKKSKYVEWTPIVDVSVANSISDKTAGGRCSYIGWEDEIGGNSRKSLNVEQLALQEYNSGRLPNTSGCDALAGGNWVGWHDEGGVVRTLFRILCLEPILLKRCKQDYFSYLTPFQSAPHDLHVAYQLVKTNSGFCEVQSFFERRKNFIEHHLTAIEECSREGICQMLFDMLKSREVTPQIKYRVDVRLRDLSQINTLSFVAASIGGKCLASMFRAMMFDYRHYRAGFPDLLLVRAYFDGNTSSSVDLGEWIGEQFSDEVQKGSEALQIFIDDDFLQGFANDDEIHLHKYRRSRSVSSLSNDLSSVTLPDSPLSLHHKHKSLSVQCLFVEVKSANDRLDVRQEDWLNIIGECGNARVCKFVKKNSASEPKPGL